MDQVNTNTSPAGVNTNELDKQGGNKPEITLPSNIEELQAMLQQEGDKRVASALKKREEKLAADYQAKIEEAKEEAVKLAKMTQAERERATFAKEKEALEKERKEFAKTQLLNQTMIELQKENLPVTFADYLMAESAEKIAENIEGFKNLWQEALQEAIDNRIKSKTPKSGTANAGITKDEFAKMNYRQRMDLYNSNPELYASLNKK